VAEAGGETLDRLLQPLVLERDDPSARLADNVVVVIATRDDGLVSRPALAHLDPLHQPHSVEQVEGAIHAGDPDSLAPVPQLVRDLKRCEAAILPGEELDHGASGAARAVATAL
jgi:hypothetical protein